MMQNGDDILAASDNELAEALRSTPRHHFYEAISAEIDCRIRTKRELAQLAEPFNPRADISADAKWLWNKIFMWFWLIPAVAGILWFIATR